MESLGCSFQSNSVFTTAQANIIEALTETPWTFISPMVGHHNLILNPYGRMSQISEKAALEVQVTGCGLRWLPAPRMVLPPRRRRRPRQGRRRSSKPHLRLRSLLTKHAASLNFLQGVFSNTTDR